MIFEAPDEIFEAPDEILMPHANEILMIFDDFEAPEDDFSKIFRGSPEIVDLEYFYDF